MSKVLNIFGLPELRQLEELFHRRRRWVKIQESGLCLSFSLRGFTFHGAHGKIQDDYFRNHLMQLSDDESRLQRMLSAEEEAKEFRDLCRQEGSIDSEGGQKLHPESVWCAIKKDPFRSSAHKIAVARRFFNHAFREFEDYSAPLFFSAMRDQQERICKLYRPPGLVLGEGLGRLFYITDGVKAINPLSQVENADSVLKEVYNCVVVDAFSHYGFAKLKTQSGLVVLGKPLAHNARITVELKWSELKRSADSPKPTLLSSGEVIWLDGVVGRRLNDFRISVALLDGKNILDRWTFDCRIPAQPETFATTSSLEVVLRGYALWYELTILPFEQAIRETLGAALEKRTQVEGASGEQESLESEKVIEQPSEAPDLELLQLDNFGAHMLLPVPWTQDRAEALEDLPGLVRCFAAASNVTALELEFEKVVGLLDPALVLPKDELRDELVKLSHQQALLLLYYAEDHGWGWSVWDKGHRVGGFRQDIEESLTQQDGDLQALQRLGLEQAQVDQMVTAVQNISQADVHDEAWTDMSAHVKLFLGVIGVGVSP